MSRAAAMSGAAARGADGSSSSDARPTTKPRGRAGSASSALGAYLHRSELPLTSLAFLLPLVVLYEVGTRYFAFDPIHQTEQRIIAFNLLQKFFVLFGATGRYMPGFAIAAILITWHIARRDPWRVRFPHVLGMSLESVLLAVPLIIIGRLTERYLANVTLAGTWGDAKGLLVLSIGAGLYEELMFRLVAFSILSALFIDLAGMRKVVGTLLVVSVSAMLFSGYHYLGDEPFRWWTFAFRTVAGLYFGAVFLCRGFGVTAGCHAGYDLCVVALRWIP